jgi:hypothetical protein
MLAGAASLLAAPLLAIVSSLVLPTMSDDATPTVAALLDHHGAMVTGLTLQMLALALLVAGTVWLAFAVAPHARSLAAGGGIVGVAGLLVIVFTNGLHVAAVPVVSALDPVQATAAVQAISGSTALSALEPLSILHVVGLVLLAVGLRRTAAAAGAVLALGGAIETVGFATGTRALVVAGFVVFLAAAAELVRRVARPAAVRERAGVPSFEPGRS